MIQLTVDNQKRKVSVADDDWLIVIDYQNDFIPPDGALAVEGGDKLIDPINKLLDEFSHSVATRDWHPEDHYSFQENGGPWPPHCLQESWGAEFHPGLNTEQFDAQVKTGSDPEDRFDYSGFSGKVSQGVSLATYLRNAGAKRLFMVGLATDYCVKHTALDGLSEGFKVFLLEDCIEPVDEQDGKAAVEEVKSNGGEVVKSSDLVF